MMIIKMMFRRLFCNIFGHNWKCFTTNKGKKWCAFCARYTGRYPKMKKINEKIG